MDAFRVAATQLDTRLGEIEHNLDGHRRLAEEAAAAGCALVVFPELSATGHSGDPEVTRTAEPHDGPIFSEIQEVARAQRIVLGYGFCEAYRGTHYNTYALVGPDGLLGLQRKVHASYDEFFHFRQAYEWTVVDLGFACVGIAICHDSDFFESWRVLALKGAEVILLPHASRTLPAGGGDLTFDGRAREALAEEIRRAQEELLDERPHPPRRHDVLARDNAVFAVHSGQVGFDGHSTHVGGGYVLAPDGSLLARTAPGPDAALVVADLDPALLEHARENPWYALRKRRPEAYAELTAPV
ncbi:MAG TPA: carbon-nitrogen hydrolase family protein [Gaiellaceae bacterium]|nr:carbon-nitrogen hydrolase family protein [Gaiellaceae bacterium]